MTGLCGSCRSSPCFSFSSQLTVGDARSPWGTAWAWGRGNARVGCPWHWHSHLPLLWLPVWRDAGGCRLPPRDP